MALTRMESEPSENISPEEYYKRINDIVKRINLSSEELNVVIETFMMDDKDIEKYVNFISDMNNSFTDIENYLSDIFTIVSLDYSLEKILNVSKRIRADMERDVIVASVHSSDELNDKIKKRI